MYVCYLNMLCEMKTCIVVEKSSTLKTKHPSLHAWQLYDRNFTNFYPDWV